MIRLYHLKCKVCNNIFEAKSSNKRLCLNCDERENYAIFWLKNTCSICGFMTYKRDQNGRGISCGCHDKAIKDWNNSIDHHKIINNRKSSSNCVICNSLNEVRDVFGRDINCGCSTSGYKRDNQYKNNPGICNICDKENLKRDWNNRGIDCECAKIFHINKIENCRKSGNCKVCNKYSEKRDEMGRGIGCGCHDNYYKILSGPGYCVKCNVWNKHRGLNSFGIECGCCKIATEKMRFNRVTRKDFYNSILSIIKFDYKEKK